MSDDLSIEGLQEAQRANLAMIAELQPSGAMGRATRFATASASRYAIGIMHVDTGAMKASSRMEVTGNQGRIFLDPSATNPRSGQLTSRYGFHEHERGGEHAFYERTVDEHGKQAASEGADHIVSTLRVVK